MGKILVIIIRAEQAKALLAKLREKLREAVGEKPPTIPQKQ